MTIVAFRLLLIISEYEHPFYLIVRPMLDQSIVCFCCTYFVHLADEMISQVSRAKSPEIILPEEVTEEAKSDIHVEGGFYVSDV